MKQIIQDYWSGNLRIEELPDFTPRGGMVLVRNAYSAISSGTEKSKVQLAEKNLIGIAKSRPDDVRLVLNNIKREGVVSTAHKVVDRLQVPTSLGYSSAGFVVDGAGYAAQARVACIGEGYACHSELVHVPSGFVVDVPENVEMADASFSGIGAIALQSLRQCDPQLGETIGVIGLGLLGQILIQALKANGVNVIGFDPDPSRVKLGMSLGLDAGTASQDADDARSVVKKATRGTGLDAVIVTAASLDNTPIRWAGDLCREKGRVIIVGLVPIDVPRKEFYEKELSVSLSRAFGPGSYDAGYIAGGDYPSGYVRWTARRNMGAFLELLAQKKMNLAPLITHRVPFEEATKAYELLKDPQQKPLGMVFEYQENAAAAPVKKIEISSASFSGKKDARSIGVIGMGNFAQTYLMPHLKKNPSVKLTGVVTARGLTASHAAKKYKFGYAATDPDQILKDPAVDTVMIATRHNTHADLVIRALENKKRVYVEKPLAINEEELSAVREAYLKHEGWIMLGFNRRFSPFVRYIAERLKDTQRPFCLTYRVNAGPLGAGHWLGNPLEGGGRLIGEGCHFVDTAQFLVDRTPVSVRGRKTPGVSDEFFVEIRYDDGSSARIEYLTRGDVSFPRERLEIFGTGFSAAMDDFSSAVWCSGLIKVAKKSFFKDLGYKNAMNSFVESLTAGTASPTPFQQVYLSSLVTLIAQKAVQSEQEIKIETGGA